MRRLKRALLFAAMAVLVAGCAKVQGGGVANADPVASVGDTPVVLELFTSQGCSSCPPADSLLSKLGRDGKLKGRIVPLAFHVDYWNNIGWTDPFSSADWTARQSSYSHQFGLTDVYTPQIVVNGRAQLVGSDEPGIWREISAASTGKAGRVTLAVDTDGTNRLTADVSAETPDALEAHTLEAVVVLYESGVSTFVKRGENTGRRLENDFIVRRLDRAFSFEPSPGAKKQGRVTFDLDPSWNAANLGVAAFLQDPETLRIFGAAAK
jgi:hypothetical protein